MPNRSAIAVAPTNIALIKYWGKRDETLMLPMNSSLSITLEAFYTRTEVTLQHPHILNPMAMDLCLLDGQPMSERDHLRISHILDLAWELSFGNTKRPWAKVESWNHVPTAAGFASSASAYAALAGAALKAITGSESDATQVACLARRGSGSATRSIHGGYVKWDKGTDPEGMDSYGKQILAPEAWPIEVLAVEVNNIPKKIKSREGMRRTLETSPLYGGWLQAAESDMTEMEDAIAQRDFQRLGSVAERNALTMHGTMLGAQPPLIYWQPETLAVMQQVWRLRETGHLCYFTIDAGPNVKVLCPPGTAHTLTPFFEKMPEVKRVIQSGLGQGIRYETKQG